MSPEGGYGDQPSAGGDAPQDAGMPNDERAPEGDPRAETLPDQDPGTVGTSASDVGPIGAGAPPAVPETDQPVTTPTHERTDLPPNIAEPTAPRGWDEAVDLAKDPAVVPDLA
jgi:hypothetical protein